MPAAIPVIVGVTAAASGAASLAAALKGPPKPKEPSGLGPSGGVSLPPSAGVNVGALPQIAIPNVNAPAVQSSVSQLPRFQIPPIANMDIKSLAQSNPQASFDRNSAQGLLQLLNSF